MTGVTDHRVAMAFLLRRQAKARERLVRGRLEADDGVRAAR